MLKLLRQKFKTKSYSNCKTINSQHLDKSEATTAGIGENVQIWPPFATSLIKDFEDLQYFHSVKMDKVASFASRDQVLLDKLKHKLLRDEAAKQQVSEACSSEPHLFSGSTRVLSSSNDS